MITLLLVSSTAWTQVRIFGRIMLNDVTPKEKLYAQPCFVFNTNDSIVTEGTRLVLDEFGHYYRDSLQHKKNVTVDLIAPLQNLQNIGDTICLAPQLRSAAEYLKCHYEIDDAQIRTQYRIIEVVTISGCYGYLHAPENKKRTRRKKKKKQ